MIAVFDTHIHVSALALSGGQGEAALLKAVAGGIQLVISRPILHELLDVLARKFGRDAEELAQVMHPKRKISVLDDEPDNRILECALAGHADVIVSGDRVMLALGEYQGVRILSLRGFLEETAPNPA